MFVALLMAGCGGEEETTKVVEDDTATSAPEPSREPSPAPVNLSTSAVEGKPFAIADLGLEMLWVKPGTFEMRSQGGFFAGERGRYSDEALHSVTLD